MYENTSYSTYSMLMMISAPAASSTVYCSSSLPLGNQLGIRITLLYCALEASPTLLSGAFVLTGLWVLLDLGSYYCLATSILLHGIEGLEMS